MMIATLLAIQAAATPPAAAPADRPLAALAMTPLAPRVTGKPRPTRADVLAAVNAEWPRYDRNHVGKLGPLEFGTWVLKANGATIGVKPVATMNATARAFARADANHDGAVTPDEMTTFVMR